MKLSYKLSKLALKDLKSIWNYTAETWSILQANNYYKLILKEIDAICKNPTKGRSILTVKPNHRIILIKSHLIIYKIENNNILIDRILHKRMDTENQFT